MNAILRTALSICLVAGLLIGAGPLLTVAPLAESLDHTSSQPEAVIFFAADGLRQDLVEEYTSHGLLPALRVLMQQGAQAADDGLLTQAPPNTGAGWYSLATGAWPGVHGSTNNTFHVNGQPFANRTTAFTPGVLQAETIAQAAERGGRKSPSSSGLVAASAPSSARRSTSAPSCPAVASPQTTSAPLTMRPSSCRSGCSMTPRSAWAALHRSPRLPHLRRSAGRTSPRRIARPCRCVCASSISASINTA